MKGPKTTYFSHDCNARNDGKVIPLRIRHGAAGYGVYFMILERLRSENDYMSIKDYNILAFDFRVDASLVKSVVEDFGLFVFTDDGKYFYSESFTKRMSNLDEARERRSKAAAQRWKRDDTVENNADAQQAKEDETSISPTPPVIRVQAEVAKEKVCESKKEIAEQTKPGKISTSVDNRKCVSRFFRKENQENLETLMMQFGLKPNEKEKLRKLAEAVIAEWNLAGVVHEDYRDWSVHLMNTMRIKQNDKRRNEKSDGTEIDAQKQPASYDFDGGFGGQDT